jgi:hypothetical protein
VVKVSASLWQQLDRIMQSGKVDLRNLQAVLAYAEEQGLLEAVRAIRGNPVRYLRCINEGMEPVDTCG